MSVQTSFLVLACKSGEVHRFERASVVAAQATRRRLSQLGFAVCVLSPGAWAK